MPLSRNISFVIRHDSAMRCSGVIAAISARSNES